MLWFNCIDWHEGTKVLCCDNEFEDNQQKPITGFAGSDMAIMFFITLWL